MANEEKIWAVQVYDSQEHTLQTQAFRTTESVKKCVADVKNQLDEQGGYRYEQAPNGHAFAFDAFCEESEEEGSERRISVDVFEVWLND